MKIITKTLRTIVTNCILLMAVYVVCDNINGWVVKLFFDDYYTFRDWLVDFIEYRTLYHILATVLLSGVISLTQQFALKFSKSIFGFLVCLVAGIAALSMANHLYWSYVQEYCFGFGITPLEDQYRYLGTPDQVQRYFQVCLCAVFAAGLLLKCFGYFLRKPVSRTVMFEITAEEDINRAALCYTMPVYYIVAGYLYFPEMPVMALLTVALLLSVAEKIIRKAAEYWKIRKYYSSAMEHDDRDWALLVFREITTDETSVIYRRFLKNVEVMQTLRENKIRVLPEELASISADSCIVMDYIDAAIPKMKDSGQKMQRLNLLQESGTFNVVCCGSIHAMPELAEAYDRCATNWDDAMENVVTLRGYLDYREKQKTLIAALQTQRLSKTNLIVDEIMALRAFLDQHVNEFLVFDNAIKWLETINYLYSLIGISRQNAALTPEIQKKIASADFGRWIEMRRSFAGNGQVAAVLKQPAVDAAVFTSFDQLWRGITDRPCVFQAFTVEELLEKTKLLRDYTRGHGVFTFEISQEINLALIEVLVFLINQLIENQLLDEDFQNLKELGWIIYSGDTPYFLYSFDKRNKEYRFDSFQKGSSITLPVDIRGSKK